MAGLIYGLDFDSIVSTLNSPDVKNVRCSQHTLWFWTLPNSGPCNPLHCQAPTAHSAQCDVKGVLQHSVSLHMCGSQELPGGCHKPRAPCVQVTMFLRSDAGLDTVATGEFNATGQRLVAALPSNLDSVDQKVDNLADEINVAVSFTAQQSLIVCPTALSKISIRR